MKRFPLDVLHYQGWNISVYNAVVGGIYDVLMPDRCGSQRFLPKARNELRVISDEVRQNDLDRVKSFEICMAVFVNNSHSALAEPNVEVIFALEYRRPVYGMRGRHAVIRARTYIVGEARFTKLTLS